MTDTATVAKELESWVLDAVRKSNTVAIEAMKVLADAAQPVTAVIPSMTPPLMYDFAGQLMAAERKLAVDTLHLTQRLAPASAKAASATHK
jgi:hypothetical protein